MRNEFCCYGKQQNHPYAKNMSGKKALNDSKSKGLGTADTLNTSRRIIKP
jgi:hypothetical protein